MSCNCCWFIQPDSAISRNRNGSRDFVMRKVTLSRSLHGGPVADPLQIYADRFSGHYGVAPLGAALNAFLTKARNARQTISITYSIINNITLTYESCVPILTPVGWRSNLSLGREPEMLSNPSEKYRPATCFELANRQWP